MSFNIYEDVRWFGVVVCGLVSFFLFFPLYMHPILDHQAMLVLLYELESS